MSVPGGAGEGRDPDAGAAGGDPAPSPGPPVAAGGGRAARWWRPALLLVLALAGAAVALSVGVPPVEQIRGWVADLGWAGPVAWAVLFAGLSLTPVPVSLLAIAGGVLFGLGAGLPATLAGKIVGATVGFALARHLGRGAVARWGDRAGRGPARLAMLDDLVRRQGLLAVIGVRLAPVLPYSVLNMAWGLTAVRLRDYVLGTAVGVAPGTSALVAIGAYGTEPGSLPFLLSVAGLGVVVLSGVVVARRRLVASRSPSRRPATPASTGGPGAEREPGRA